MGSVNQVVKLEEPELEGMLMLHTATSLHRRANLFL